MSRQWFGKYRAIVVDVNDTDQLGRVKARIPAVLGDVISDWVWPCFPAPGWCWIPKVDDRVWVEFEGGDIDRPIYVGVWYAGPDGESELPDAVKTDNYPLIKAATTPLGHKIVLSDVPDEAKIEVESSSGHKITLDDKKDEEKVSVTSQGGHSVTLDDKSGDETIKVEHKDGTSKIEIDKDGKVTITAKDDVLVNPGLAKKCILAQDDGGVLTDAIIPACLFTGAPFVGSVTVRAKTL